MKRILIKSFQIIKDSAKIIEEHGNLSHVSIFFDYCNFLITEYQPLSEYVNMILLFSDDSQYHVEGALCGYYGNSTRAAVKVLVSLGLNEKEVSSIIYWHDAAQFSINDNQIDRKSLDYSVLFLPSIRYDVNSSSCANKILNNFNIFYDVNRKEVYYYNPQRHSFRGFVNLLSYLGEVEFEYYIGDNSPLGEYFRVNKMEYSIRLRDTLRTPWITLALHGEQFTLYCLIDYQCELEVIEAIYFALSYDFLKNNEIHKGYINKRNGFLGKIHRTLFRKSSYPRELHNSIHIPKRTEKIR